MLDGEKRELARVPCRVPVVLAWDEVAIEAQTLDLSRNGVGLVCPLAHLGLEGVENVLQLVRELADVLPPMMSCCFHPERLGGLVTREIRPMRVDLQHGVHPAVELGCRLDRPFSDADAAAMGVAIPVRGETVAEAARRPAQPPRARNPAPRLVVREAGGGGEAGASTVRRRVRLTPLRTPREAPVQAWTEHLDRRRVVLRIPNRTKLAIASWSDDVGILLLSFCEAYGARFTLDVFDGYRLLWSGPVRVRSVEVLNETPNAMLLGFEFGEPLRGEEIAALDLQPA